MRALEEKGHTGFILFVIEILCANRHSHILSVYLANPLSYKKADCEKSFCTETHSFKYSTKQPGWRSSDADAMQ